MRLRASGAGWSSRVSTEIWCSMLEQEFVLAGDNCVVLSKMMQDGAEGPNWAKLQFIVRTMKRFQIW